MPLPRIIPVIDLMGGQVVRAVGGRRSEYRPVKSVLTDSTEPGEVARALVAATGADCIYVADLDAIVHGRPNPDGVRAVSNVALRTLCDGGFRIGDDFGWHARSNVHCVVGTETGSVSLVSMIRQWGCGVSIDMREGRVVGDATAWGDTLDPVEVAARACDAGAGTVILLDLARVGTARGAGTERQVQAVRRGVPGIELIAGGGVQGWDDVRRLGDAGADAVLVASALHDGTMGRQP